MVDNINVRMPEVFVPKEIYTNPLLDFSQTVDAETQEVKSDKGARAKFKGLTFFIDQKGNLNIKGSLHKYFNGGLHNYNDFTKIDLDEVLNELAEVLGLDLTKCILHGIEIGVNVTTPIPSTEVVNNTLTHLNEQYKHYSFNGAVFKEATHTKFYLKAYNKSLQYQRKGFKIKKEIFRFEIKYKKMHHLNVLGIKTLNDLYDSQLLRIASELILEKWEKSVFYDPTLKLEKVNKHTREVKAHQWQNPNWWLSLSKQNRANHKKRMNEVIARNSNNIKEVITKRMRDKINSAFKKCVLSTQVENEVEKASNTRENQNKECVLNTPLYIGVHGTLIPTHFNITNTVIKKPRIQRSRYSA